MDYKEQLAQQYKRESIALEKLILFYQKEDSMHVEKANFLVARQLGNVIKNVTFLDALQTSLHQPEHFKYSDDFRACLQQVIASFSGIKAVREEIRAKYAHRMAEYDIFDANRKKSFDELMLQCEQLLSSRSVSIQFNSKKPKQVFKRQVTQDPNQGRLRLILNEFNAQIQNYVQEYKDLNECLNAEFQFGFLLEQQQQIPPTNRYEEILCKRIRIHLEFMHRLLSTPKEKVENQTFDNTELNAKQQMKQKQIVNQFREAHIKQIQTEQNQKDSQLQQQTAERRQWRKENKIDYKNKEMEIERNRFTQQREYKKKHILQIIQEHTEPMKPYVRKRIKQAYTDNDYMESQVQGLIKFTKND
ncbi:Hypothetical_protein [Hexamita inflata]|uniref:Hypothetical_protein n=1 Tax=Hexamita inflata TaxID=28002 RepID=A0AA86UVB5_9EUKA|nr:Hypothetical protein HINF_LOCUS56894 [Hexamita inflata]